MPEGDDTDLESALRIRNISKDFPPTTALRDVSFAVRPGELHALVGGNGSGKSTLIKILAGVYRANPGGTIAVGRKNVAAEAITPNMARNLGLRFVHQTPAVFPSLSVAENIAIGTSFEKSRIGAIRWRALRRRTTALLDRYGIEVPPGKLAGALRPAEQTMIAIVRALADLEGATTGVLVLDEVTASLPKAEVIQLMAVLDRCREAGQSILFVSHRLDEVIDSADRTTVLRDGRYVDTVDRENITESTLIELIVGRAVSQAFPPPVEARSDKVALSVRRLSGGPIRELSFELHRGEILGIAGLLGSGRSELLKMLFGAHPVESGAVEIEGKPARFRDIGDAIAAGVAYIPEDRKSEAIFPRMTVAENVAAARIASYWSKLRLQHGKIRADARIATAQFMIRAVSERQEVTTLSGGNQQKVILARWLLRRPHILLLDEPTHGVDVGSRAEIYKLVQQAIVGGASVVLVTSDFEELARVSDRVIVISDGSVAAELHAPNLDAARLTELAYSERREAVA